MSFSRIPSALPSSAPGPAALVTSRVSGAAIGGLVGAACFLCLACGADRSASDRYGADSGMEPLAPSDASHRDAETVADGPDAVLADGGEAVTRAFEPSEELLACAELALGLPQTIAEAVDHINALPRPTSLPCFLASLPRPLQLVATFNITSAQPAEGRRSPRMFVVSESLVMSIVPDGIGSLLLEFGEFVAPDRTIKAEIAFPVTSPVSQADPFTRVKFSEDLTSCALCHREESPHPTIPNAFDSLAFRPQPGTEVPIGEVRQSHLTCEHGSEPYRCDMLAALFGFGPVTQGAFSKDVPLFF